MTRHQLWIGISPLVLMALGACRPADQPAPVDYDAYIWDSPVPAGVPDEASDLAARLETEVQKVVRAGHLAPMRTLYGETTPHYFWYNTFDTIYALSLAYPYLGAPLKEQVRTYLQDELEAYPPWVDAYGERFLPAEEGTKREPDELPDGIRGQETGHVEYGFQTQPKLFALYALWLYAHATGDWDTIESHWEEIRTFYVSGRDEVTRFYCSIAGAIGMARMADGKPSKDLEMIDMAAADARSGFDAGRDFMQMARNAEEVFKWEWNGWDWTRPEVYVGFQFQDLSPEIGRFMRDVPELRALVTGDPEENEHSLRRGEYLFPLWYMAQPAAWSRTYGEGSGQPPNIRGWLFPIHAWVLQDPPSKLRSYIDVPDALVGDYCHIRNLVLAIQAYAP